MLPLVTELGYEVGCKLHAKKSTYRSDGTELRTGLLAELLGRRETVDRILERMRSNPKLGLMAPQGSRLSLADHDVNIQNREWLNEMLRRLGRPEEIGRYSFRFPAGSMFWFRPRALRP